MQMQRKRNAIAIQTQRRQSLRSTETERELLCLLLYVQCWLSEV